MDKKEELRILGKLSCVSDTLSGAKDVANKVRAKLDGAEDEEECYKEPLSVVEWLDSVWRQARDVHDKLNRIDNLL